MRRAGLALFVLLIFALPARAAGPCSLKSFEGDDFTVCPFDSKKQQLMMTDTYPSGMALRTFDALAAVLRSSGPVRFAMNAGMFDDQGLAIGLFVELGATHHRLNTANGAGNFHLKPNGVFSVDADGTLHVETTPRYIKRKPKPIWATQSGPMLVIGGRLHPKFAADGPSRYVRNGVGVADSHHAYFAISEGPVSFGKFARLFRDGLHCPDALYFDGSVSSLWVPSQGRKDASHLLGPMVAVLDR